MTSVRASAAANSCRVALKLHSSLKCLWAQHRSVSVHSGKWGVYARLRATAVRVTRLEYRQPFTGLVSSNLVLSASNQLRPCRQQFRERVEGLLREALERVVPANDCDRLIVGPDFQ